jgi:hypothetical protein
MHNAIRNSICFLVKYKVVVKPDIYFLMKFQTPYKA